MQRFLRFFRKTSVKVSLALIFILFCVSCFLYPNFYKAQMRKALSYYWVWKGDKFYKNRKQHEAVESYKKGIEYNPKHVRAKYNLANILVTYEDYYSALDFYRSALDVKPDFQIARIDYAIVLANATFNYDAAIVEYEKAIELKPRWYFIPFIGNKKIYKHNKGVAYYNLGLAWRGKSLLIGERTVASRQYLNNAIEAYKNALKIRKNYDTYYNLGLANQLLNNYPEAGKYYCLAIEMAPMDYEAHYNLAILLKSMKKYKESIDEFKKAGLILDTKGDGVKTRYIYDILNDTVQQMIATNDYNALVEHIDQEMAAFDRETTYVGGKLVLAGDLDRAMVKNFRTCASKKYFEELEAKASGRDVR